RQLDQVALVGPDAPVLGLAALGAGLVQVLAVGPPEGGDRHLELAALERGDVLDAALAVAALAHDQGPALVLEAGREDLAAAGAAAVHHADHGEVEVAAGVPAVERLLLADPRPDRHDQAVVDEQVGDVHGAVQVTARVEAQVNDHTLDAVLGQGLHDVAQVAGGVAGEAR